MLRVRRTESGQSETSLVVWGVVGTIAVIFLLIFGISFIRGWKSVPPDKLLLHYTGGPIQGQHFKESIDPGTSTQFYGLMENYYFLPTTQRNYIISADPNHGDRKGVDSIVAPSKDKVSMTVEASVYFKLNTATNDIKGFNGGTLRRFFEQICLHDNCYDLTPGAGWDKMLDQYFRPQLDQALRAEIGKYNYVDQWQNPDVRAEIQNSIGPDLKERINNAIGGDFFCGPDSTETKCSDFGFVLQAVNPPGEVAQAYSQTAAAQQLVQKADQEGQARVKAAQADASAQAARAAAPAVPPAASDFIRAQAMARCAEKPDCRLVIVDSPGTSIQVPSG